MKRRINGLICCVIITSILTPITLAQEERATEATRALHSLFQSEWEYRLEQNPTWASSLGDRRWNDKWSDLSLAAINNRNERRKQSLQRLREIDRNLLSTADQLNYDLFEKDYTTSIEEHEFRWYLIPLNQRGGIQTTSELGDSLRFETIRDYDDWIARMRAFPAYMDQTTALMREGMTARIILPRIIMQRIPDQIDSQIVDDPRDSPFFKPFTRVPASIEEAEKERLVRAGEEAIRTAIVPSYSRFRAFFVNEYLPSCFPQVGIWQIPGGDRLYRFFARRYTTTGMTPEQIHEIGLKEVSRIRAEMLKIKEEVGFKGDLGEFFTFLRTDPMFYYGSPEELLDAYRAISKKIDPHMVRVFKTLPRMPYGVEPIPDNIAPDTTTAYYRRPAADGSRAGTYFVNLYRPETRPKYEMMALSLHEAVPGHHLQIALAMELGEIPNFRRFGGYTAFVEGWGLYAESLGEDLGLYDDPYSKFGQLTYEMWRAVRLVVDTGMHYMQWDRQRAIDFFMENAAKQENDVVNEIDRYIAWPGQALAYKIGELKIKELRARATTQLERAFDIREFHEVVLGSGAVPLDILERIVVDWISRVSRSPEEAGKSQGR